MRVVAILCFLLSLSGCASIPFTTMTRFSQFDEHNLTQLDAKQIMVKVSLRNDYSLKPDSTKLEMSYQPDNVNRKTEAALTLRQLSKVEEKRSVGIFSPDVEVVTYEFAVDEAGAEKLKQVQDQFIKADHKGTISFSISSSFTPKDEADVKKEVTMWVDLKLYEKEGYFSLFDAATLKVEAI